MKKRILSMILALLMLASAVSCGKEENADNVENSTEINSDTEENTVPEETEPTYTPAVRDMDGFTLSIIHQAQADMSWTELMLAPEEMTGDMVNDAIYERNERIMEKYNSRLNVEERWVDAGFIQSQVMAGDTTYDVMMPREYVISTAARYLMSWETLPNITFENDWWYPEATNVFKFGDKLLAAANSISLSCVSRASGFAFNKKIYDSMSFEKSIYDYVYDGKWTFDTFNTIAGTVYLDLNGDGTHDKDDQYGIGESSYKEVFARLINGSGVSFIVKDENGFPMFTLPEDEVSINKLMTIMTLAQNQDIYMNPDKSNADSASAYGDLKKDTALFRLCHAKAMSGVLRDAEVDYGIVPNPKHDESQESYCSTTWAFEIMTLPITVPEDRFDNLGLLLEALAFDSHTSVLEVYKEVAVKTKYAQDNDSLNMLDIIFKSMSFDLGILLWEGDIVNPLILKLFASGGDDMMSALTSQKKVIGKKLENFSENVIKTYSADGNN